MSMLEKLFGPSIGKLEARKDLSSLSRVILHKKAETAVDAIHAIVRIGGEEAAQILVKYLSITDGARASEVQHGLATLRKAAIRPLVGAATASDRSLRKGALQTLIAIPEEQAITESLESANAPEVLAAYYLGVGRPDKCVRIGKPAVIALGQRVVFGEPSALAREVLLNILLKIDEDELVPVLDLMLGRHEGSLRIQAEKWLQSMAMDTARKPSTRQKAKSKVDAFQKMRDGLSLSGGLPEADQSTIELLKKMHIPLPLPDHASFAAMLGLRKQNLPEDMVLTSLALGCMNIGHFDDALAYLVHAAQAGGLWKGTRQLANALLERIGSRHFPVCDICSSAVMKGKGYLLTTADVVGSPRYWKKYFDRHQAQFKAMGIEAYEAFLGNAVLRFSCAKMVAGQQLPWLVCCNCIDMFSINREQASEHAEMWWKTGFTFTPPQSGPAPMSAVDMGDEKTMFEDASQFCSEG